jgi:hypothetical protein
MLFLVSPRIPCGIQRCSRVWNLFSVRASFWLHMSAIPERTTWCSGFVLWTWDQYNSYCFAKLYSPSSSLLGPFAWNSKQYCYLSLTISIIIHAYKELWFWCTQWIPCTNDNHEERTMLPQALYIRKRPPDCPLNSSIFNLFQDSEPVGSAALQSLGVQRPWLVGTGREHGSQRSTWSVDFWGRV